MLNRVKHKIKEIIYSLVPPPECNETFSQAGEDAIIDFLFTTKRVPTISYLELGVYKPKTASNTYRFYKKGCRGVLVEADQSLLAEIRNVRPKDKLLHYGVGLDGSREADFYVFEEPAHSTFSKEEADHRVKHGSYKLIGVQKVPLLTINQILQENFKKVPELLSIDIEGLDLEVLKSLDLEKYPIPVICAETCTYSESHLKPKNKAIEAFMLSKGYFVYADTYINSIFVRKDWFHQSR